MEVEVVGVKAMDVVNKGVMVVNKVVMVEDQTWSS